jgi:hypothetical protein
MMAIVLIGIRTQCSIGRGRSLAVVRFGLEMSSIGFGFLVGRPTPDQ